MNDIDILLDIYRDDPETAIAMAQQDSLLSDLFLGQVSHLESGASEIGWNYLIMMVLGLPGHYRHNAFKRLLQLSQQFQAQPELLEELVAARENSQVIDRFVTYATFAMKPRYRAYCEQRWMPTDASM